MCLVRDLHTWQTMCSVGPWASIPHLNPHILAQGPPGNVEDRVSGAGWSKVEGGTGRDVQAQPS